MCFSLFLLTLGHERPYNIGLCATFKWKRRNRERLCMIRRRASERVWQAVWTSAAKGAEKTTHACLLSLISKMCLKFKNASRLSRFFLVYFLALYVCTWQGKKIKLASFIRRSFSNQFPNCSNWMDWFFFRVLSIGSLADWLAGPRIP